MLDQIFSEILNMSVTASYVIIFILLARIFLRKVPKIFSYALWSVALFRLICPWSFESVWSLLAIGGKTVERFSTVSSSSAGQTVGLSAVANSLIYDGSGSAALSNGLTQAASQPVIGNWLTILWLTGMGTLFIYGLVKMFNFKKELKNAVWEKDNVYLTDRLSTPFVIGVIRPKIYLPEFLSGEEKEYILLHEQTHIRRFDHVIRLVSFLVLCLHWFNPLVWAAFFLSGKDMEMSCDEAVIKKMGAGVKKDYSRSLLSFATGRRIIGATPLAFGESDIKSRIKNVLNYKKPVFWVIVLALVAVLALGAGLIANPKVEANSNHGVNLSNGKETSDNKIEASLDAAVSQAILDYNRNVFKREKRTIRTEAHTIIGTEKESPVSGSNNETITVYAMALYLEFKAENGTLSEESGNHTPVAITFEIEPDGTYVMKDYWVPRDGHYYAKSIEKRFPAKYADKAMDTQMYILAHSIACYEQAIAQANLDVKPQIERLIKTITTPAQVSNPGYYIETHDIEYRTLLYYGQYTLDYCFERFEKGGETGLEGRIMAYACQDILKAKGIDFDDSSYGTGQDWYDRIKDSIKR